MSEEKARVARVGIGRLYNLGNYEHIRYDLTIEIPEGVDVKESVSKMRQILRALKPKRSEGYEVRRARELAAMPPEDREDYAIKHGLTLEDFQKADSAVQILAQRDERRKAALELFNNLGGESVYTDHKEQWDDDYDY